LGWFEGNRRLFTALRTAGTRLNFVVPVIPTRHRGCPQYCNPLCLAGLAAFWLILELLVVKKQLLPCCENEIGPTVYALQYFVLEFHGRRSFALLAAHSHGGVSNAWWQRRRLYSPLFAALGSAHHVPFRTLTNCRNAEL
jgi:hypothetical protein